MSVTTIIILILIGTGLFFWLRTIRFHEPEEGQLYVLKWFNRHIAIIGCGVVNIPISPDRLDPGILDTDQPVATPIAVRVDMTTSFMITIWPLRGAVFEYRYKKFRTRKKVAETGGVPVWEPYVGLDNNKRPVKDTSPNTIILGEWVERDKTSLFVRERDEIVIHIRSIDGVEAVVKGYLKYLVWNMSRAISTTYQAKADPEKAIIDRFQDWAKNKKYFKEIQGISFEKIEANNARTFFRELNESIYATGVIVEDVELTQFIIEPQSQDVADALEGIIENEFLKDAEVIESERKKIEGQGNQDKQMLENIAAEDLLKRQSTVAVMQDKGLKQNEVDQYRAEKAIDLENNAKLIDKLGEYKKIPDITEVDKYKHLGKTKGTVVIHEANSAGGSNLDDVLEGNIISKSIKPTKGGN
jgi:hypothetical protein